MKFAGILRDHEHSRIKIGHSLSEYQINKDIQFENTEKIISYLNNGKVVIAFLHYVNDKMGNPIAPLIFYTDGVWIWPSYLAYYYSNGYPSLVPNEFVDEMKKNNFTPPSVDEGKILEAQKLYAITYGNVSK